MEEARSWRVAIPRGPSQHLAGDYEAETVASPAASVYPAVGPARPLGPGAVVLQRLYAPDTTTPEVLFVMSKPADAAQSPAKRDDAEAQPPASEWEYAVVGDDGFVKERGHIDACARCHAEAPNDSLFGKAR